MPSLLSLSTLLCEFLQLWTRITLALNYIALLRYEEIVKGKVVYVAGGAGQNAARAAAVSIV